MKPGLFTNMGEWPIDLRSIMFGQCGIKKNVFNRCCNKMETHICNTHKAGGVTPPIWSTLFGQCHYASLYLHGATFYNNTASKYKLSESNTRIISGVGDNATNMRLGSLKAILSYKCEDGLPTTNSKCLSHHAVETLWIFLRSWSKKSPALQSLSLQSCASADIPVFKIFLFSRWKWRTALRSLGPDDLLQMQQRWEGENHREAKCRKTNRRGTKCRNGSVEKHNVESVHGNHGNHPNCTAVTTFLTIRFRKLFDLIWQQPDGDHGGYYLR